MANLPRTGTQSIERAVRVLRVLAERGRSGWRISDLAERTDLALATCHRILDGLVRERMAIHVASNNRYAIGPLLAELAASRPDWVDLPGVVAPDLRQLARRYRVVSFLYARSDNDFVCLARQDGIEMRALAVQRGTRRPLVTSAGGAAILVKLPADERRAVIRANLADLRSFGKERISGIRAMLRESTQCSFGLNRAQVVAGVHSFGVAVSDPASGTVLGSVLMSGPPERLPLEQIMRILPQLRQFADQVGRRWTGSRGEPRPEPAKVVTSTRAFPGAR
jgi:DNA-binding IclR family transcriptional regulator